MRTPLIIALSVPALVAQTSPAAGEWTGTIHVGQTELGLDVALAAGPPASGRISIPLQGLKDLPLAGVSLAGNEVTFALASLTGNPTFKGRLAGGEIRGFLSQGGQEYPFELKRPGPRTVCPTGTTERELQVGPDAYRLPATLTLPEGKGPWPLLVLVHGSGPNDRDESLGPSKPFRDLAWGLAQAGVAVLRYDKRTYVYKGKSAPDLQRFTVQDEVVEDTARAVAQAAAWPGIDARRIFVLGHSLGGMLVPRIARATPQAAGYIIAAGPARPLEDLILEQVRRKALPAASLKQVEDEVARIKALDPAKPSTAMVFSSPASYWLDLRGYQPATEARTIPQRLLVIQGDKDCQVTLDDYALWQKALGTRKDVRMKRYPSLNHLFMPVEGTSTGEEYTRPGQHVLPEVVQDLAAWIQGR